MTEAHSPRRVWLVLLALTAAYVLAQALGLAELLDPDQLRAWVRSAGMWGAALFVFVFVAGVLAQIPGVLFITAAPVIFPPISAWALCLVASNLAVNANFAMVRFLGGAAALRSERPWVRRVLARLEQQPVRSVALLRLVLIVLPPVTAALALTPVSAKDHALGSALGVALPVTAIVFAELWLLGMT